MSQKTTESRFSDLVTGRLSRDQEEARNLWSPLAQELNRAGPDAVNEYLAAAKQGLVERVATLLAQVEEKVNG